MTATLYDRHAGWLAIRLARRCNDRDLVQAEANYVNQVDLPTARRQLRAH
jgi:hypothetical protein